MAVSERRLLRIQERIKEADIYVSSLDSSRKQDILQGFERAKGFLRTLLAQRIPLRTFPRLRFHWDDTPERAQRLEQLFEMLRAEREQKAQEDVFEQDSVTPDTPKDTEAP